MTSRRWLLAGLATIAATLLTGRVLSGWYVDYQWFAVQGAAPLWWARALDLVLLRASAFVVAFLFAFANLFAVRHSVRSLRLPRRVGNLEFSEEVSARILNNAVLVMALAIGLVLAMPQSDWMSVELIRNGLPFGETDPYFRIDLGAWMYRLPLEASLHVWAMISLVVVTLLVVFLYALTPSLRWEGGRVQVSSWVRRHLFLLAGVLLLLLAWSYRLDAYGLLHEGTGPAGAVSAVDHRISIPANLGLALLAVASAILVSWTGWIGQTRIAFANITIMLLAALAVRQVAPAIGERFVTEADNEAREQSYREIRNGYTRRAYGVDAVETVAAGEPAPAFRDALRGASLWDSEAMNRLLGATRQGARPNGSLAWQGEDGRLAAAILEQPVGPEAADALPAWNLMRVATDVLDDRGVPAARPDPQLADGTVLRGILVHDSAAAYYVLADTGRRVAARALDSFVSRVAHAWHLQNTSLLSRHPGPSPPRLLLHRDVRERVSRLYPFLWQGSGLTPIAWRDSLTWAVHLYAASSWYPLSLPLDLHGRDVRYVQHAGVALVNAHTGITTALVSPRAGPMASTWTRRFPELFSAPSRFENGFLARIPPPVDGAVVVARALAHTGRRGEFEVRAHLPPVPGDSAYSPLNPAPFYNPAVDGVSVALPLLDPTETLRGVLVASGGADVRLQWITDSVPGPRWGRLTTLLHAAADSVRAATRSIQPVAGAVRILPTSTGLTAIQTHYIVRPDGVPQVLVAAIARGSRVTAGRTLMEAAGLPDPVVTSGPMTAEEFRRRVDALYEAMREAMRRGDWGGVGAAFEALGRVLRAPRQP